MRAGLGGSADRGRELAQAGAQAAGASWPRRERRPRARAGPAGEGADTTRARPSVAVDRD